VPTEASTAKGQAGLVQDSDALDEDPASTRVLVLLRNPAGLDLGTEPLPLQLVDHAGRLHAGHADNTGLARITHLAPGSYWISPIVAGYQRTVKRVTIEPTGALQQFELAVAPSTVVGVVVGTLSGERIETGLHLVRAPAAAYRLTVVATREPPGSRFSDTGAVRPLAATLWKTGDLTRGLPVGALGALEVFSEPPIQVHLVLHQTVIATRRIDGSRERIDFRIDPNQVLDALGGLRARFVDVETRQPIVGMVCALVDPSGRFVTSSTRANGEVRFVEQAAGSWALRSTPHRYAEVDLRVELQAGVVTDLGEFALERETTLQGRILDGPKDFTRPHVAMRRLDERTRAIGFDRAEHRPVATDDGSLRVVGLARELYLLRTENHALSHAEGTSTRWVTGNCLADLRQGSLEDFVIPFHRARPVVLRPDESVRDGRFQVLDDRGWPIVDGDFAGTTPRRLDLPPGSFRVVVRDTSDVLVAERMLVVGAEPVDLAIAR
jgi:hypothetical protein